MLDVAADASQGGHRVLDGTGADKGPPELVRQAEADHGEDFVEPFQYRSRHVGRVVLETPGQVLQEPLGLLGVLLVPSLVQRLLDAGVEMPVQAVCDVAALVHLAAPDGGGYPEGVADCLGLRPRAVDDGQPGDSGL